MGIDYRSKDPLILRGHEIVIRGRSDGVAEVFYQDQSWGLIDLEELLNITYDVLSNGRRFKKWRRRG
ncbi:MAG: hypothetical protein DRJ03_17565 [Chloroflexi bacterium]|nr:MAG: hypothetical protein DRJ03_17565 [Chloroflexota bacterium]